MKTLKNALSLLSGDLNYDQVAEAKQIIKQFLKIPESKIKNQTNTHPLTNEEIVEKILASNEVMLYSPPLSSLIADTKDICVSKLKPEFVLCIKYVSHDVSYDMNDIYYEYITIRNHGQNNEWAAFRRSEQGWITCMQDDILVDEEGNIIDIKGG